MLLIFDTLRVWWMKVVEPDASIIDSARRNRLRTFAMIFLVAGLMTAAMTVGYFVRGIGGSREAQLHALSVFICTVLLFASVWLARRGHLQIALVLLALYGAPANFALVVMRNTELSIQLYDYLALVTVVGSLFLSRRLMFAMFIYNAAWMLATPLLAPSVGLDDVLEGPFLFNAMMLALSLVGIWLYRNADKEQHDAVERERIFYKSLFEQSNDAVFLLDLNGRNFAANHRAEELLGYPMSYLVQMTSAQPVVPSEREKSEARLESLLRGETLQPYERTFVHRGGHEIYAEVNAALIRDPHGNPLHIQSIVRDVSDRKRQQGEHEKFVRAEERMGAMRRLVAAVSHDFRTALAQIEMGTYLAGRALADGKSEAVVQRLERISEGVKHMAEQLQNLTTVSALVTLHVEPCDLNTLVQSALVRVQPNADACGIRLQTVLDPSMTSIWVDQDKLRDALRHLLENAITHTPPGNRVTISTRVEGGNAVLEVADEGKGISPEDLQYLFDPLYRADFARTVDSRGVGLGLTLVKLVAEAHGGKVEAESAVDQGSTFRIVLPILDNETVYQ
jgi:PAS domain S-box-containing protein